MYILLLAGGGGTRLWPLSTKEEPKQFLLLPGETESLFQKTLRRCLQLTDLSHIIILTAERYKEQIGQQIASMQLTVLPENILGEPVPKGTLPALLYGVQEVQRRGGQLVAAFPCDHSIEKEEAFLDTVRTALSHTEQAIVTLGITPSGPETNYGYIKPGESYETAYGVERFCEKPDLETAKQYVKEGYLWNSGMFLFSISLFLEEVRVHAPEVFAAFQNPATAFEKTPSISIDYGVMEKTERIRVVPAAFGWSDLGGFRALKQFFAEQQDEQNNVKIGTVQTVDCQQCLFSSDTVSIHAVGLSDMAVVEHKGKLLICPMDRLGDISQFSK